MLPRSPPVGGSWLKMAEAVQRIIVRGRFPGRIPPMLNRSSTGWNLPVAG